MSEKQEDPPKHTGRKIAAAISLLGSASGITGVAVLDPGWLSGTSSSTGLQRWQLLLSGSYFLFFVSTSIPGRLDQKLGRFQIFGTTTTVRCPPFFVCSISYSS